MRLDKFIADNTELSRKDVQTAVKARRVTVDGEIVKKADQKINPSQVVTLDNIPVVELGLIYLMLHKPAGYVSATEDAEHPTVIDLIDEPYKHQLQIAGRLDMDTTGLVLLTNDGDWNHRVTSPKHDHTKTYEVTTADIIPESAIELFKAGMTLHGEAKKTLPAQLILIDSHTAELTIQEGKYHQVKRMFAALGNRVVTLHRRAIGQLLLDENLPAGKYRLLSDADLELVNKPRWNE